MSVVERHLRSLVLEALDDTRVVVVLGARQVGKSTLVQDIAAVKAVFSPRERPSRAAENNGPTAIKPRRLASVIRPERLRASK